jgi:hypothetical protein
MPNPHIDVLGVHRLTVTEAMVRDQFEILCDSHAPEREQREKKQRIRDQLESVVLLEVLVKDRNEKFDVGHFTQVQVGVDRGNWQAPWAEAFLTPDGDALIGEQWGDAPETGTFRCTFYLHFFQPGVPLTTSYGEIPCTPATEMPSRLEKLVPFEPVD